MCDVKVRELKPGEHKDALRIVVRAMCDNPLHARAFGDHPVKRMQAVEHLQRALWASVAARGRFLCTERDGSIEGILGMAQRKHTLGETAKMVPSLFLGFSPSVMMRLVRWFSQWLKRMPREPYWHLGPVAVDVPHQGQGIGSALMHDFCSHADKHGALAYLETDKYLNVKFYLKFGFETMDEAEVIGIPNWFMIRYPQV